jgi:hypothetical protein
MKKNVLFSLLVVLASFLCVVPAQAHRPYVKKLYILSGPDKKPLIVEKLVGDNVIGVNPEKLQIRNQNGAVIAYTQTAYHIVIHCSSIQSCWVFPYSSALIEPVHLDYKALDYSAINPENHSKELSDYLAGRSNRLQTLNLIAPSYRDKPYHFSEGPSWIQLFSPIIMTQFSDYFGLSMLYFLPTLFLPVYWASATGKGLDRQENRWIIGLLLLIPYAYFVFINTMLILFGHSLSLLYGFATIGLSIWCGKHISKIVLNARLKKKTNTVDIHA